MSNVPSGAPAGIAKPDQYMIRIVSHSNLFYWWPVWAIGFLMAGLTFLDGHRVAIVPTDTVAYTQARVQIRSDGQDTSLDNRDVLVAPAGKHLPTEDGKVVEPYMRMADNKGYGVFYAFVLLLVIVITNVPLRGLWSVVVIITIVALCIIFALAGWWGPILDRLGRLHIHMNGAGYLMISAILLLIWLVTFLFFDPQMYMIFTPKQLRVRQEIGGGEVAYDTTGMVLQKQRSDIFRHWFLGLGSGDLIVNTSGATAHHIEMHNVLFVGHKLRQIEEMMQMVEVAP